MNAVAGREALTQELEAKHAEAVSSSHQFDLAGISVWGLLVCENSSCVVFIYIAPQLVDCCYGGM